jgi:hypothetical protein
MFSIDSLSIFILCLLFMFISEFSVGFLVIKNLSSTVHVDTVEGLWQCRSWGRGQGQMPPGVTGKYFSCRFWPKNSQKLCFA